MFFESDFSYLEGTNCYCSEESASSIREAMSLIPLSAVHYMGTGDYHYCTLFRAERIEEDFALVLFDQHPDDQHSAFDEEMLSCGSWVADVRLLSHCKKDLWIDGKGQIARGAASDIKELPLYLSVDLDILSSEYARTDWDQGEMSLDELCEKIREISRGHRIIGADICGGITESKGGTQRDFELNGKAIEAVREVLQEIL